MSTSPSDGEILTIKQVADYLKVTERTIYRLAGAKKIPAFKVAFHGAPMKGVDIVAEFDDAYVYVELKDYDDQSAYDVVKAANDDERKARQDSFKWLKNYLKYKFRDSHLYRYAEGKVDKPVHYICVLTFDNALNSRMLNELKRELPVGKKPRRWAQALAKSCQVVNLDKWNEVFPKWPAVRLTPAPTATVGAAT